MAHASGRWWSPGELLQAKLLRRALDVLALVRPALLRFGATLAADRAHDTKDFVAALRALGVVPHLSHHITKHGSATERATTRHASYAQSINARRGIERVFGWLETIGLLRKTLFRGRRPVGWLSCSAWRHTTS